MMDLDVDSTTANISPTDSFSAANSTSPGSNFQRKRKIKKNANFQGSKSARLAPDLDIVSGFAFLSFANLEDLDHHIEDTETKSRSLSINVGQKRKIQPKHDEKPVEKVEIPRTTSKRVRVPSQKILESYATSDIPINKLVSNDIQNKTAEKIKISPDDKVSCMHFKRTHFTGSSLVSKTSCSDDGMMSLECSETIDTCMFDDEDVKPKLKHDNILNVKLSQEKEQNEIPKNERISDTSCQTMFRIKKKKKKRPKTVDPQIQPQSSSTAEIVDVDVDVIEVDLEKNIQLEPSDLQKSVEVIPISDEIIDEMKDFDAREKYKEMQATKYFDARNQKFKFSNKVEKIDYCARSGGISLVEKHHLRQAAVKDFDSNSYQQPRIIEDSCNVSINSDNSSGNESSSNSIPLEQEDFQSRKVRIFAGSSSVFVSAEDPVDEMEVNVSDNSDKAHHAPINIVKALPKNYLFGHFSTYPDKTTEGTVDVSIQIYDNDIQLYMNYASDFYGQIIKIITPDHEETAKNTNSCLPHSSSYSGVPKFLQPQEYVKAIRSATERNRRHNLGDLFNHLKNEIFDEVREFYFSKQAILSKALEVISTEDQQHYELNKEKAKLSAKNQLLRENLNKLLFGERAQSATKVDVDKVTEYLKTNLDIKIELPSKAKTKGQSTQDKNNPEPSDSTKNVTKKGRPPLEGKLFPKINIQPKAVANQEIQIPKPKQLSISNSTNAVTYNNSKKFVVIAPRDTEIKEVPSNKANEQSADKDAAAEVCILKPKQEPISDKPLEKIVCNISRYRVQQAGNITGMKLVKNTAEPFKAIESKNVVHIKIANDVMKQVNNAGTELNNVQKKDSIVAKDIKSKGEPQPTASTQTTPHDIEQSSDLQNTGNTKQAMLKVNTEKQLILHKASLGTTTLGANTVLSLKPTDSLKKTVNILNENASNQSSTQAVSNVVTTLTMATKTMVAVSKLPSGLSSQDGQTQSKETTVPSVCHSDIVAVNRIKATTTAVQGQKPSLAQITMMDPKQVMAASPIPVTMVNPGFAAATTSKHVQISNQKGLTVVNPKTSQVPVTMATQGNISFATPRLITMSAQGPTAIAAKGHVTISSPSNVPMSNLLRKPVVSKQPEQRFVKVLPHPSSSPVVQRQVNIVSSSAVSGSSPIRFIFKQTGNPISTPMEQVKGVLQSQGLLRLPIAKASIQPHGGPVSNALQTPNIRFLLQNISKPGIQSNQPKNVSTQKVFYTKPLVRIQPQPSKQSQQNVASSVPGNGVANLSVSSTNGAVKLTSISVNSASNTTTQIAHNYSGQTVSKNSSQTATQNQGLFNQQQQQQYTISSGQVILKNSSQSVTSNQGVLTQQSNNNGPKEMTSPQVAQQVSAFQHQSSAPSAVVQSPVTPDANKNIFSGMEEIVAKIPTPLPPSPQQQNLSVQNTYDKMLTNPLEATVTLQRLSQDRLRSPAKTATTYNDNQITTVCSTNSSLQTTDMTLSGYRRSDEIRTSSFPSNQNNFSGSAEQTNITHSNTCSSTVVAPYPPSATKQDKTCSVVESTVDNSNVVTADTLSTWSIDSSIPDITSELGHQDHSLEEMFGSTQSDKTRIPAINQDC